MNPGLSDSKDTVEIIAIRIMISMVIVLLMCHKKIIKAELTKCY